MCRRKFDECAPHIPARYILALLGFLGITLQYIMKVNLSVAIVAMVSQQYGNETDLSNDTCPSDSTQDAVNPGEDVEFEWDTTMQGNLLSSYYYGYVSTQLLGGYLAQKFGGRLVLGPGIAITGVLTLLTTFVARKSFVGLCVLRALEGCASGVVIPSMQTMFSRWYHPKERQRLSGFIFSSINFGSLVGMGLSGLLVDWSGWPAVFYVSGGMAVVWFIFWVALAYDSPKSHPRISKKEKDYILNGLGHDSSKFLRVPQKVPWKHILLCPAIWAAILLHTGSAWVLYTILNELPTYLNNILHYNVKNSGVISSLPYLFAWISGSTSGALSQWIREKGYLSHLVTYKVFNGIVCVGAAACFFVITLAGCDSTTIVAMFVLIMFCNGCIYGGSYMNHVDLVPNHAGAISGILHTVLNTPGFITPVVTSALLDGQQTRSNWKKVFYVAMGVVSGTYLVYLVFGSVTKRTWNVYGMEDEHPEEEINKKEIPEELVDTSTNLKPDIDLPRYGI